MQRLILACLLVLGFGRLSAAQNVLVFDENTGHQLALQAANSIPGATVTRARIGDFHTLLMSQKWDVVLVDAPSNLPAAGFGALVDYVNAGGRAAVSFWTWQSEPALAEAFGVQRLTDISLTGGATLHDWGTTTKFMGVTMPNSDWHNHWADDGDKFNLLQKDAIPAAGLVETPAEGEAVVVVANGGRTVAAPLFDEAGDTWLMDGSGVQLWVNIIDTLLVAK